MEANATRAYQKPHASSSGVPIPTILVDQVLVKVHSIAQHPVPPVPDRSIEADIPRVAEIVTGKIATDRLHDSSLHLPW